VTVLNALIFLHVLIFGFWIGADIAVLYATRYVINERYSVETRAAFARALFRLDTSPTVCLTLQLPIGLTMASIMGLLRIDTVWLVLAWLLAITWMLVMLRMIHGSTLASLALRRVERGFRIVLTLGLLGFGILSLLTGWPFIVPWLAVKVLLFAVIMIATIGIDECVKPFFPALNRLVEGDTGPAVNAVVASSLTRAYPFVGLLYAGVLAAAAVAIF
jgi:hypothetical protein